MPFTDQSLRVLPDAAVAVFLSPLRPRVAPVSSRLLPALAVMAALFFSMVAHGADLNATVLAQVQSMPSGGRYGVNRLAAERFSAAVGIMNGALSVQAEGTAPNFCSEATYLVFLKTIAASVQPDAATLNALLVRAQSDGQGVWGRWNANGPGTARLFRELGLGRNFESFEQARPGDFMKIFWTSEVGRRERGHSVVYLGLESRDGVEMVRFWSSNQPAGYGVKTVPRSKIAYAIFSRLEHPEALLRLGALPAADPYLSRLTTVRSSIHEARAQAGM